MSRSSTLTIALLLLQGCVFDSHGLPREPMVDAPPAPPDAALLADTSGDQPPLWDYEPMSDAPFLVDSSLLADQQVPDSAPPDATITYLDEQFANTLGQMTVTRGKWWSTKTAAQQGEEDFNGALLQAPLPVSDYTVETTLKVVSIKGGTGQPAGAGIAARVGPLSGPPGDVPPMYGCAVSPNADQLLLVYGDGSSSTFAILGSQPVNIQLGDEYTLQMQLQGDKIRCALPLIPIPDITVTHSDHTAGEVGLFTMFAKAAFDYITVTSAP